MTGRRLYDLYCDSYAKAPTWARREIKETLPAWPFLSYVEQGIWSRVAVRMKGVRR